MNRVHRWLVKKHLATKDPWSVFFILGVIPFLYLVAAFLLLLTMAERL